MKNEKLLLYLNIYLKRIKVPTFKLWVVDNSCQTFALRCFQSWLEAFIQPKILQLLVLKQSFVASLIDVWNHLPLYLRESESVESFNKKLKPWIKTNLKSEELRQKLLYFIRKSIKSINQSSMSFSADPAILHLVCHFQFW